MSEDLTRAAQDVASALVEAKLLHDALVPLERHGLDLAAWPAARNARPWAP